MHWWAVLLIVLGAVVFAAVATVIAFATIPRVQRLFLLAPLSPPTWVVPIHNPGRMGLPHARLVAIPTAGGAAVLRGWHLPPPGPPFPPVPPSPPSTVGTGRHRPSAAKVVSGPAAVAEAAALDAHLDMRLATDGHPAVLYCHGHGGSRGTPPSRTAWARDVAARAGVHVLSWDPRGYGDTDAWPGGPTEATLKEDGAAAAAWLAARLAGEPRPEVGDAATSAPAASTPAPRPPTISAAAAAAARRRLVVYGHSAGGSVALAAASAVPPAGVVLSGAWTCLPDAAAAHPATAPLRAVPGLFQALQSRVVDHLDNEAALAGVAAPTSHGGQDGSGGGDGVSDGGGRVGGGLACPLLLLHNPADPVMPYAHALRLRAAAIAGGVPVALVPTPGRGHKAGWRSAPFFPAFTGWLAEVTAAEGTGREIKGGGGDKGGWRHLVAPLEEEVESKVAEGGSTAV
ncbi:hypothetical protein MMPV_003279 [Pyropia vietnamensis]